MSNYLPGAILIGLIALFNIWSWRRRAKRRAVMTPAERNEEDKEIRAFISEGW